MQQTGKGPSAQTTRQERQALSISQMKELKTWCTNSGLWKGRELGAMHVLLKTKTQEQNSSVQNATLGCKPAPASRYITPNCISKYQFILKWNSGSHRLLLMNWYFFS